MVDHGHTPKGRAYLVTEYYPGGSLQNASLRFDKPADGLRFFGRIVDAMAHAHQQERPVCHLDLKPDNIFLKDPGTPIVGDFGICYIDDENTVLSREGARPSVWYCAPELRKPTVAANTELKVADVYSLGKLLYWLFTGNVYDGSEDDYSRKEERRLACLRPEDPVFVHVDKLVDHSVRSKAGDRLESAAELGRRVKEAITEAR
jgi:serine/threonine protein kinase